MNSKIADSWWATFIILGLCYGVVFLAAYQGWKKKRGRRG